MEPGKTFIRVITPVLFPCCQVESGQLWAVLVSPIASILGLMSVLVTGGAGYIGSHVARILSESGSEVVVVDNLSTGLNSRVSGLPSLNLELSAEGATASLEQLMAQHKVTAVVHLAALKQVGQSVLQPEEYFQKNLGGQANLLTAMKNQGVSKLVFSSSAASYGVPDVDLVSEDQRPEPINPYGQTKLIGEWMAKNAETAWGLRHVSLRYFNVAGAGWPDLADTQKLNLIPIVFAALKEGSKPKVFGDDYQTPDGSCIRDYVHVMDLAKAHVAALDYLENDSRPHAVFNVGTGQGSSVFEVMDQIRKTTGIDFEHEIAPRRAGDPPRLIADVSRIEQTINWKSKNGLEEIVDSAWQALNK
jgi:UDP-glucose 4-epimerase